MSKKLKMPAKGLFGLPSSVRQTNNEENPSTQVPENHDTEVLEHYDTEVSSISSTSVLENPSTEVLENEDIQVAKGSSTKDSRYQSSGILPKPQKNNRTKDDKKPTRKQASVHLTGSALKALHLYAYEEGLEKSEVVEKALRKFIPKRFFQ